MLTTNLLFVLALQAAAPPALPPLPAVDCASAEHRQMDFWLGTWEVRSADGARLVGRNVIEKTLDGCLVTERFENLAPRGGTGALYRGMSYSAYDPHERRWRQFYVDNRGRPTWFFGGASGSGLTFLAQEQAPQAPYLRRMEVQPQPDGAVRQTGYVSLDHGLTWQQIYNFLYRRVALQQAGESGARTPIE